MKPLHIEYTIITESHHKICLSRWEAVTYWSDLPVDEQATGEMFKTTWEKTDGHWDEILRVSVNPYQH